MLKAAFSMNPHGVALFKGAFNKGYLFLPTLVECRDGKLYRQTHRTFALYCRERWEFSRQHAYRLIDASATAELVTHGLQTINERQARELAKAPAALFKRRQYGGSSGKR